MIGSWWYQRMALFVLSLLLLASCGGSLSPAEETSSNTGRATARPELAEADVPTHQSQVDEPPGSADPTPTVEPIEHMLGTTAQHTFRYAGMRSISRPGCGHKVWGEQRARPTSKLETRN